MDDPPGGIVRKGRGVRIPLRAAAGAVTPREADG